MNQALLDLKQSLRSYADIPDQEFDNLAKGLTLTRINKGEYFVRIGEKVKACFILSGVFKSFYLDKQGNEFVRSFASATNFLAPLSAGLRGGPSNLAIRALHDATVLSADYTYWRSVIGRHPCWDEVHRKVAERFYIDREEHVIELLTLPAIERYHRFLDRFPDIAPQIPQKDIAAYIGITAVALSRIIAKES